MINPFSSRSTIRKSEYFFDRDREARVLLGYMKQQISCSIVGQRRIGKSSFLNWITLPSTIERFSTASTDSEIAKCLFVLIDFQRVISFDKDEFWGLLVEEVSKQLEQSGEPHLASQAKVDAKIAFDSRQVRFIQFESFVRKVIDSGHKLILLFDEFEYSAENPALDVSFYMQLRSLVASGGTGYVTATARPLYDLTHSREIKSSPFFNIFQSLFLGHFSIEDAKGMLAYLSRTSGQSFDETDIEFLIGLAGPFPFFCQLAGFILYESYRQHPDQSRNRHYEHVLTEFAIQTDSHYQYFWDILEDEERAVLKNLANDQSVLAYHPRTLKGLVDKSLVVAINNVYKPFSSTFTRFIKDVRWVVESYQIEEIPGPCANELIELIVSYYHAMGFTQEYDPVPLRNREVAGTFELVFRHVARYGFQVEYVFIDLETRNLSELAEFTAKVRTSKRIQNNKFIFVSPRSVISVFETIAMQATELEGLGAEIWLREDILARLREVPKLYGSAIDYVRRWQRRL